MLFLNRALLFWWNEIKLQVKQNENYGIRAEYIEIIVSKKEALNG